MQAITEQSRRHPRALRAYHASAQNHSDATADLQSAVRGSLIITVILDRIYIQFSHGRCHRRMQWISVRGVFRKMYEYKRYVYYTNIRSCVRLYSYAIDQPTDRGGDYSFDWIGVFFLPRPQRRHNLRCQCH